MMGSMEIKRTKRRYGIMLYLATGFTPWGRKFEYDYAGESRPHLALCGKKWIICCGLTLGKEEAAQFVSDGLLRDGMPDGKGRPTLVITRHGREWLEKNY